MLKNRKSSGYSLFLVSILLMLLLASIIYAANYCVGDNCYINTCTLLNETLGNNCTKDFYLNQSIDCSGEPDWSDAPCKTTYFNGTFYGQNNTIANLTVVCGTDYCGLFGRGPSSGVKPKFYDLGLLELNVTSASYNVGGLIGKYAGGIYNSYLYGTVSGAFYVGGLVGAYADGVDNSYSYAIVNGTYYVGGLVGRNADGVDNSYSYANVTGSSMMIGGLVGKFAGGVDNSYSYATVSGNTWVGGLVGGEAGDINNSYSYGIVTGTNKVGGLIGSSYYETNVDNSFTTANVSCTGSKCGSVFGSSYGVTFNNVYWNNISGNLNYSYNDGAAAPGCTAIQDNESYFKVQSNAPISSWDFTNIWAISDILMNGFPYLRIQSFPVLYNNYAGSTTNFDAEPDKNNVSNAVLQSGSGKVEWEGNINVAGADFDSHATIGNDIVSFNLSHFDSSINSSANVSFFTDGCEFFQLYYSDTYYTTAAEIRQNGVLMANETINGQDCIDDTICTNVNCTGTTLRVTMLHFDGVSGSGSVIPEFSTITLMLAMVIVIGGFFVIRKRQYTH